MPDISDLSEREIEILKLVAGGASNKQIAHALTISTNTVKVHLRNIFNKIEVASRTEAAMFAVRQGLVDGGVTNFDGEHAIFEGTPTPNRAMGTENRDLIFGRRWILIGSPLVVILAIILIVIFGNGLGVWPMASNEPSSSAPMPRWQELAPMLTARSNLAVAVYENQIYAIAGETKDGVTGVVEMFDPAANRWETRSPKPVAVKDASAVVIRGEIYVPGGLMDNGRPTDIMEVYNPLENTWERRASLPISLSAHSLAAFEGNLYLFGGWDGVRYVNIVLEYNPTEDEWVEHKPMPTARGYAGTAVSGGKIFIIGGYDGNRALDVNEVYWPERDDGYSDPWSTASNLPERRYAMGITNIADIIYLVGGEGEDSENLSPLEYIPSLNIWGQFENPLPQHWSFMGLVNLDTRLLAIGGKVDGEPSPISMVYQAIYTISIPLIR
jgi:DNA-binding CsgD family transcriptional regulator